MIFSIDFDGTLCENNYPEIGNPKTKMINKCIELHSLGHKLILNTCRTGKYLEQAKEWCVKNGLIFDSINENLPEKTGAFENDSRKIGADYYIDDKNMSIEDFCNFKSPYKIVCPICGGEMDETYRGTHYCKNCEEYILGG